MNNIKIDFSNFDLKEDKWLDVFDDFIEFIEENEEENLKKLDIMIEQ